jgi:hypothetical protein
MKGGALKAIAQSSGASEAQPVARWIKGVVVLTVCLNVVGATIAVANPGAMLPAGEHMTSAARLYAGYLVSRDLSLAVVLLAFLVIRARQGLAAALLMGALTQVFDIVIDTSSGRAVLVPGLIVLCGLLLLAAGGASGAPVWRRSAWLAVDAPHRNVDRTSVRSRLAGTRT